MWKYLWSHSIHWNIFHITYFLSSVSKLWKYLHLLKYLMLHWEAFFFLLIQLSAIYKCSLCSSRTLASRVAASQLELQKQSNSKGTKQIMCSLPSHPVCTRNQVCFIQTAYTAKLSNNFNLNFQSFRRKRYDWATVW